MSDSSISPPVAACIATLAPGDTVQSEYLAQLEAHGDLGALIDAFARSDQAPLRLGGWEIALLNEDEARAFLRSCGAADVLDRHKHFLVVGTDVGALWAVVGWSGKVPEVVYELDEEYRTAKPQGTLAAWLVHLALMEAAPDFSRPRNSELADQVNPIRLEETDDLPPDPKAWTPADDAVVAKLKGGGHLGFVELGGVTAAVHKKGVRAWIDCKKKAKGVFKIAAYGWDAAGKVVWLRTPEGAGCVTLPGLEVAVRERGLARSNLLAALPDGNAITPDGSHLQLLERAGDSIRISFKYHTGFKDFFMVGSRGEWIACGDWEVQRVLLYRWDGEHLRVQGGWRGSLGWLRQRDGALYTSLPEGRGARVLGLP